MPQDPRGVVKIRHDIVKPAQAKRSTHAILMHSNIAELKSCLSYGFRPRESVAFQIIRTGLYVETKLVSHVILKLMTMQDGVQPTAKTREGGHG
jgi:hypothetical protein